MTDVGKLTSIDYYASAVADQLVVGRRQTFTNIDTKTSIRPSFSRRDYEYYRPGEAIPSDPRSLMEACDYYYNNLGLVRNIIDLQSDFACQGIAITSDDPSVQELFQRWFSYVDGRNLSERLLNVFYRLGNSIIQRTWGTMSATDAAVYRMAKLPVPKVKLPARYNVLDPLQLEVVGETLSQWVDQHEYRIVIPSQAITLMRKAELTPAERRVISRLPAQIRNAIAEGKRYVELDSADLRCFYYKRDSWNAWGRGIIASVLEDLVLLQKTKLADLAALDGAVSSVRLWNLGSLDHQLAPAPGAANRLARMLENNVGGGTIDIIWGPDLKLTESNSNIYKFLGEEKYAATLQSIWSGLGVPPTLTGSSTQSGFTNNYISLKTLVERLEYGRVQLRTFWEQEIDLVREALNIKTPVYLRFDRMTLSDESAERALLIQLLDRQIISDQSVLERFGENPHLEKVRVQRETELRLTEEKPEKLGPFQPVEEPSDSETPEAGRPRNAKDSTKRKQKVVKPRSGKTGGRAA